MREIRKRETEREIGKERNKETEGERVTCDGAVMKVISRASGDDGGDLAGKSRGRDLLSNRAMAAFSPLYNSRSWIYWRFDRFGADSALTQSSQHESFRDAADSVESAPSPPDLAPKVDSRRVLGTATAVPDMIWLRLWTLLKRQEGDPLCFCHLSLPLDVVAASGIAVAATFLFCPLH